MELANAADNAPADGGSAREAPGNEPEPMQAPAGQPEASPDFIPTGPEAPTRTADGAQHQPGAATAVNLGAPLGAAAGSAGGAAEGGDMTEGGAVKIEPAARPAISIQLPEQLNRGPTPPPLLGHVKTQKIFEVGMRVSAQASFDQQHHAAEIVDRRTVGEETKYYVHYSDFNKRLDEWLPASRVDSYIPAATPGAAVQDMSVLLSPMSPTDGVTPTNGDRKLTRNLKRRYDEIHHRERPVEDLAPIDQTLEREHEEKTKVKNIHTIEIGKFEMDTWYYSPYPDLYSMNSKLYVCEYCLKYMRKDKTYLAHKLRCSHRSPPGTEIYRHPNRPGIASLSFWEVDGRKEKVYCQNLCLLSKLFLDHKTLYYDVDPFLFYVLCERDEHGHHLVGYFSKEKASMEEFNLACILTLPAYQRKGYGRFLIEFSYELSKVEGKIGTPERPLSDLGQVSYRSYWTRVVLEMLREYRGSLSIKDISARTSIRPDDIVATLQSLGLLKWWKGQHIISATPKLIEEHLRASRAPNRNMDIDPARLSWTPYGMLPMRKPR